MSGIAERPQAVLHRGSLPVSEFSVLLTVCLTTTVAVAAALLSAAASTRNIALPVFLVGAVLMFGSGLTDLAQAREARFARALIVGGLLWSLSALTASPQPTLYSVGHVGLWFVVLAIVYLLLSYPSGRLVERADRALFAGGAALLCLLYLPTALFAQQFPHPSPWSTCTSGCPRNVFSVAHSTSGPMLGVVGAVRETLTVAVVVAIAVVLTRRRRKAGPALGRFYAPIAVLAVFQAVVFAVYLPLRAAAPGSGAMPVVSWIFVLSLPAVGLACSMGRLYRRLYAADAIDRLARSLSTGASAELVRRALSSALGDPSLRIFRSASFDSEAWVDESGAPVGPQHAPDARFTEIASGTRRIAIAHHPSVTVDPFLIQAAGSYALAALENERLNGELHSSREELAESRLSRLTTEQSARRKIERDLHDGAQQRLVALRVKLELAAAGMESQDPAHAEKIRALEGDVDATIDEVRSLARGIYPALLAETGLERALRGASRDAPVPTTVRADRLGRYSAETETTVYSCCSEALQNACKHATGATAVTISVWQDRQLHFEVRDDGVGFDPRTVAYGAGLTNLTDRLEAVGGTVMIQSARDRGTVVRGSLPRA